ncbi:putative addiction module antidote protein [Spirochaetia bacterium]|nr:putative addiction module antidote protein [Spirochaetia bacterium]
MEQTVEKVTFEDWDPADDIETKEDVASILEVALEENDPEFLLSVIGDIARSKGMAQLARELDVDRAGLYKSFSPEGNPSFLTVVKVLNNLGFGLSIHQKKAS